MRSIFNYPPMLLACVMFALTTTPADAVDPPAGSTDPAAKSPPLRVYPPGDMEGRRRWLSALLRTPGEFTDHQVAEFKANIAAMSPDEVQNVKYDDATIAQFKDEVAHMHPDEVRQLLDSWRRDSISIEREGQAEAARRQQEVDAAIKRDQNLQRAERDAQKFAAASIKTSDKRVAAQRSEALRAGERMRRDSLYYNLSRPNYWGSYYARPWNRPYYGPWR